MNIEFITIIQLIRLYDFVIYNFLLLNLTVYKTNHVSLQKLVKLNNANRNLKGKNMIGSILNQPQTK